MASEAAPDGNRPGRAVRTADTHCPYCALQCGMTLRETPTAGVEVQARDFPTNRGGLCQKGWTAAELLNHPDRLTSPLIRDPEDGTLRPASWETALGLIAGRIREIQREHGRDAVAVFGGGGLTNEKAYTLGKFARVGLGTRMIDYNGRFCMSSAAAAGTRAFGLDRGLPFPLADIGRADTLLLVGANVAETMPPFGRYLLEQRAAGGTLIVIDPRATPTVRQSTLHLQPTPGTDLAIANGLLHIACAEGWLDKAYIDARTSGFEDVRRTVAGYWPARVERLTGIPVADLETAARALALADRAIILTARGAEQHAKGVDTVSAFINLALALGLVGRPGSGYGCLTGQGNGQGGREHGQKADQLPGYRRIDDPAAREHVAAVWGVAPADLPGAGVSASELLARLGIEAGPRALLVFGSNPVVSAPRAAAVEDRLRSLDLLVVADFVLSESAAIADVVLPTAQWAEEDGTMTNLEGRVLRRTALRPPPPGVWTDLQIIAELAKRLMAPVVRHDAGKDSAGDTGKDGAGDTAGLSGGLASATGAPGDARAGGGARFSADPYVVFEELRRASAGGLADYAGISWERVAAEDGVFWPCPSTEHPGTPRPFAQRFATPDGRARFVAVEYRPAVEDVCVDYPLYLTTGRVLAQYQSGAQTRRIGPLRTAAPRAFVELHPDLAARLGVEQGDQVRVHSRRGELLAPARLTDTIRPDTVFVPFHWGGTERANSLTNDALDPISRMPEFKVCAVRVERA